MTKAEALEKMMFLRARTVENGCTENEANIAMQCLNAIMKDFNLSLTEAEILKDEMAMVTLEGNVRQPIHTLCNDIGYYTDCQNWYNAGKGYMTYTFVGTREDALNAQYLFAMLNSAIGFELRKYKKGKGRDVRRDEGFIRGICSRLGERLREMKREAERETPDANQHGLIKRTKAQRIQEELEELGIQLRTVSDTARYSHDAYATGYKKGDSIEIHKGVADNPQERKQLR